MSSSPKYSQARLEAQRALALATERSRLAAEEEKKRKIREQEERLRLKQAEIAARTKAQAEAEQSLINLKARFCGIESDNLINLWAGPEVLAVKTQIEELASMIKSQALDTLPTKIDRINLECDSLLSKTQERQLLEDSRSYIQTSIAAGLLTMGFQVGAPYLEKCQDYSSDVILKAVRPDGRSMQVQVPVDGLVSYSVNGYPFRPIMENHGSAKLKTCDEAQNMIENLHKAVKEQFGVDMGEIKWEGKPPMRISENQAKLPYQDAVTRQHGRLK